MGELAVLQMGFVQAAQLLSTMKQKNAESKKIHSVRKPSRRLNSNVTHQDFYGARANAAGLAASITNVSGPIIMVWHMSDARLKHHSRERYCVFNVNFHKDYQ